MANSVVKNPTVSIIVVARNEARPLQRLLVDLARQDYPSGQMELLLVDSESVDDTRKVMEYAASKHDYHMVRVMSNPQIRLANGWNEGIRCSSGELVVRIDAHASVPPNFIRESVEAVSDGFDIAGGARPSILEPGSETAWREVLLCVESSRLGGSPASYRNAKTVARAERVFHAMCKREVFETVGLLNTRLGRTEDNEFFYRAGRAGLIIGLSPYICSYQFVRSSLRRMVRQKFGNGYWVGLTTSVCPRAFSLFHFIPMMFVVALTGCLCVMPVSPIALGALLLVYVVAVTSTCVKTARSKAHVAWYALSPVVALCVHVAYGFGTLVGLCAIPFKGGRRLRGAETCVPAPSPW